MNRLTSILFYPSNLKRKLLFLFFDIISFILSIYLAFQIRTEIHGGYLSYDIYLIALVFLSIKLLVFTSFRLYDISWKFVSLQDVANISKACLLSNGILFIVIYGFNLQTFASFPRSILLIDLVLSFLLSSGFKISKRMYLEVMRQSIRKHELKRTIIIGAGSSGEQLLRDINRSQTRRFYLIGFVDDDPLKQEIYLQGVRVLGPVSKLPEIIKKYNIETILISVLSADRMFHRKILNIARESGVNDVKVVSTVNDISNSISVGVKDIRDIDLSDLIGRQAVSINTKDISSYIRNKRVLITGAAGSIGSEISRQVISYDPAEIAILDVNESDLFDLEMELSRAKKSANIRMYLCDISNKHKVDKTFEDFLPDVVFHAAAYKHVPVMEKFPEEAARVNIIGTHNLAVSAVMYGVKNFILISTDKAVNPSSVMGASKRIAEYIVTSAGKGSSSNFVAVRFGNVIGSRGSALPIFIEQLKNGGPITVTHPEMKRYFMTIPEAVALVLQAATTGKSGDVFVLDMGEPVKIIDLARDLIMLHNLVPEKDIKIKYTGIREGEKLFEEVLTAEEGVISTSHEKIFRARLVCMHNSDSIASMVKEFAGLNGTATKRDWIELFKYYIPSFKPSYDVDIFEQEEINSKLIALSLQSAAKDGSVSG
jgi:FlaA1/EpsC-like NDP-sugar epimerase